MQRQKKPAPVKADEIPLADWRSYIGFSAALGRLASLAQRGALPQVLLITGREGLGKSVLIRAVAALYSCHQGHACGACDACRLVMRGQDPNLLVLDGRQSLKVEDAAQLQEHLSVKAARSAESPQARRIGVIIDAEQLTLQATNRLLKTLEEPPSGSCLLLTTSRVKNLLPTLLSRCVRWHIQPPPLEATEAWLTAHLKGKDGGEELAALSPSALKALIERLALSPGRVLSHLQAQAQGLASKSEGDLRPLLQSREVGDLLKEAEELCRQKSWNVQDIAREAEYALNLCYKQALAENAAGLRRGDLGPSVIKPRREFLRRLKLLAGKQKIALNAQLAAERLGLFPHLR